MSDDSPSVLPSQVVLTLVESVGRRADAEFYLRLFRELPRHSFAIVAPDAASLDEAEGRVVENMRFLAHLGLVAPVVLGLSDPSAAASLSGPLCRDLTAVGITCQRYEASRPALPTQLRDDLDRGRVPVVVFATDASTPGERYQAVGTWAGALKTRKLVLVRARGGVGPHSDGRLELSPGHELVTTARGISVVNLHRDHSALRRSGILKTDEIELLDGASQAMKTALSDTTNGAGELASNDRLVTSVTAPINLLHELFTVKGAGSLIRHGSQIERHADYAKLDQPRLSALLERTFARKLRRGFFQQRPTAVYVEQGYRGAAIVQKRQSLSFLSKFVVDQLAQGLGIGRDLWEAVVADHASLFWRSRPNNPITHWYESQCQGMVRTGRWNVYFRGVSHGDIPALIEHATSLPSDFDE